MNEKQEITLTQICFEMLTDCFVGVTAKLPPTPPSPFFKFENEVTHGTFEIAQSNLKASCTAIR
jgi:hypothetical protein